MTHHEIPSLAPRPREPGDPRVSVVMPTYRRAHQIGDTIRTLLEQSWTDFELLIRDDGADADGTEAAVWEAAAGDPRVHYHRNPRNLRMPANLNAGIQDTRGEMIVVCHDHDLYAPTYLEELVAAAERHPTATYVHTALGLVTQEGEVVPQAMGDWPELTPGAEWLRFMATRLECPVCALTLVRRSTYEEHGLYDPAYGFISDVEMWMRLALHGDVAYVRKPLIHVREREPDHFAHDIYAKLLKTNMRMRRRYIPQAFEYPGALLQQAEVEVRAVGRRVKNAFSAISRRLRSSVRVIPQ